jgi:hypothetical protein
MLYLALIALPVFNVAHSHLLVMTTKQRISLLSFYNNYFGGAFIISHHEVRNKIRCSKAIAEMFGEFPRGQSIMLCGYELPDLIRCVEAASHGSVLEIEQKRKVNYYSEEFCEVVQYLKTDDDFYFGENPDDCGLFDIEEEIEEYEEPEITEEERELLQDSSSSGEENDEISAKEKKFREIERYMFSSQGSW